ncbi:MAG: hypothetical protein IT555_02965 [Acetobacteraceae bacterium]|nr:hypothetical protein [Acetobacteraceae bacterium]
MINQPTQLAADLARLRTATQADGARGIHALILAILARFLARLEQVFLLWQSGQLPPPPIRQSHHRQPRETPNSPRRAANRRTGRRTGRRARRRAVRGTGAQPCRARIRVRAIPGRAARAAPASAPSRAIITTARAAPLLANAENTPSRIAYPRPICSAIKINGGSRGQCPLAFPCFLPQDNPRNLV